MNDLGILDKIEIDIGKRFHKANYIMQKYDETESLLIWTPKSFPRRPSVPSREEVYNQSKLEYRQCLEDLQFCATRRQELVNKINTLKDTISDTGSSTDMFAVSETSNHELDQYRSESLLSDTGTSTKYIPPMIIILIILMVLVLWFYLA